MEEESFFSKLKNKAKTYLVNVATAISAFAPMTASAENQARPQNEIPPLQELRQQLRQQNLDAQKTLNESSTFNSTELLSQQNLKEALQSDSLKAMQQIQANRQKYGDVSLTDIVAQTDTLDTSNKVLGYYQNNTNTITINYDKNTPEHLKMITHDNLYIHENKHKSNALAGMNKIPLLPEYAINRNIHDEISATLSELVLLRQEYIKTKDISVFDKEPFFKYYKQAIQNGTVNPFSGYKEDFDKEMSFMVNQTKHRWMMRCYPTSNYQKQIKSQYIYNSDHQLNKEQNQKNYEKVLKIAYTIGGVDFSNYLTSDVQVSNQTLDKFEAERKTIKNDYSNQEFAKDFNLSAYNGKMSIDQYFQLVQHQQHIKNIKQDSTNLEQIANATQTLKNSNSSETEKQQAQAILNQIKTKAQNLPEDIQYKNFDNITRLVGRANAENQDKSVTMPEAEFNKMLDALYSQSLTGTPEKTNLRSLLVPVDMIADTYLEMEDNTKQDTKIPNTPQYRTWDKDNHVSEPMHNILPDLNQQFIKLPTRTKDGKSINQAPRNNTNIQQLNNNYSR